MIRRYLRTSAFMMFVVVALLGAAPVWSLSVIPTPAVNGDQLVFFYDARANRIPFLVVSNFADEAVTLEIVWYSDDLNQRLATQIETLAGGANRIFDPSHVQGVNGNVGLTIVTPVRSPTDLTPVVPPAAVNSGTPPLFGGYTLADLSTNSAFGQNPLARVAVDGSGERAASGATVDGTTVRYQRFAPDALILPFYFDPTSDGLTNRVILSAFEDRYGTGFSIGPVSVPFAYRFVDSSGTLVVDSEVTVSGVYINDVQSLAGGVALTTSGKGFFANDALPLPPNGNLFGIVSQSLGPFAVGQQMPGVFTAPRLVVDQENLRDGALSGQGFGRRDFSGSGDPDPAGTTFDIEVAQTFTVGITGRLARIRVVLRDVEDDTTQSVALDVRTAGPAPDSDDREVLGTVRVPASALAGVDTENPATWPSFDLDALAIDVTAGQTLAFSIRTSDPKGYNVPLEDTNTYSGGGSYRRNRAQTSTWTVDRNASDYLFQTFVRVP